MLYYLLVREGGFGVRNGAYFPPQQAAYHEEVSEDVRSRALSYGTECTNGYIELLEHVLQVQTHTKYICTVL